MDTDTQWDAVRSSLSTIYPDIGHIAGRKQSGRDINGQQAIDTAQPADSRTFQEDLLYFHMLSIDCVFRGCCVCIEDIECIPVP